ncbi:hypothetical protein GLOTRDRAFT_139431 [Gloeophyllum trabeum ATCC 11539]|uniref:Uncharacterized protein n=1 Tax=Gloeophyllum trabeum (strain ATCC 11539 / FP-39264 / Madison 617) TaxID=670483 RepID=S7Q3A8_GLOTA|nr:uncharacterized protein GLOTRDRAFT_139431 [Gloeophyllum trabeum ATCC 11539]EPQ54002.1 hypothetical protein GLOTRDRAFT_139431 [Gloeophyllum trabeum ATCC 11539]
MPPSSRVEKPLPPLPDNIPHRSSSLKETSKTRRGVIDVDEDRPKLKHQNTLPKTKREQWAGQVQRPTSPLRFLSKLGHSPSVPKNVSPTTGRDEDWDWDMYDSNPPDGFEFDGEARDGRFAQSPKSKTSIADHPEEFSMYPRIPHPYSAPSSIPAFRRETAEDDRALYLTVAPDCDESDGGVTVVVQDRNPMKTCHDSVLTIGGAVRMLSPREQVRSRDDQF